MTETHKAIFGGVVLVLAVLKAYDYVRLIARFIAAVGHATYGVLTDLCLGVARHWRAYAVSREQRGAKRLEGLTATQVDTAQNLAGVVASQHDLLTRGKRKGSKRPPDDDPRPDKPSKADIKTHNHLAEVVAGQLEQITALRNELALEREALAQARQDASTAQAPEDSHVQ